MLTRHSRIWNRASALLLLGLSLAAVAPASAAADSREVIRDCFEDGKLDGDYTRKELREAEEALPADLDEYSTCRDAIDSAQAQFRKLREQQDGGPGGGGPGGPVDPAAAAANAAGDRAALNAATKAAESSNSAPEVSIGGRKLKPGGGGLYNAAGAANDLPLPLIAALAALALLTAAALAFLSVRRLPAGLLRRLPAGLRGRIHAPGAGAPQPRRVALRFLRR